MKISSIGNALTSLGFTAKVLGEVKGNLGVPYHHDASICSCTCTFQADQQAQKPAFALHTFRLKHWEVLSRNADSMSNLSGIEYSVAVHPVRV